MAQYLKRGFVFSSLLIASSIAMADQSAAVPMQENATKTVVSDTFDAERFKGRNAVRGDWKLADGLISVTQDNELYAKYKNHGPLLVYNHEFINASAMIRFRGRDNQAVVFTMDGDAGHVVRVKMTPGRPTVLLAWAKDSKKPKVLARDLPSINENEWTDLVVAADGDEATVSVNGSSHSVRFAGINRPKTNAKIGFSFGSIEIDSFRLDEPQ